MTQTQRAPSKHRASRQWMHCALSLALTGLLVGVLTVFIPQPQTDTAQAANAWDFDPGYIDERRAGAIVSESASAELPSVERFESLQHHLPQRLRNANGQQGC